MPITALYGSLLGLLFVLLAVRVIEARRRSKVPLGDGGDAALLRRIRVHANFAEYVPLSLILLALAESLKTNGLLLHGLGLALLAGRTLHAIGVSRAPENFNLRVAGMAATFTVIIVAALACFAGALSGGLLK